MPIPLGKDMEKLKILLSKQKQSCNNIDEAGRCVGRL